MKPRIILLYGGESVEHEISCRSAVYIAQTLLDDGYEVVPIGIDHGGVWHLQDHVTCDMSRDEASVVSCIPGRGLSCGGLFVEGEIIFPMLHGSYGEDGTIQGLLEMLPYPAASASVFASASGISKAHTKLVALSAGIPTPRHLCMRRDELDLSRIAALGWPLFIKPNSCGSSVGISRVDEPQDLEQACELAFRFDPYLLAEEMIAGREIQCAFIHDGEELFISPFGEIRTAGGFYSYQTKYTPSGKVTTRIPAALHEAQETDLKQAVEKLVKIMHRPLFGRADFFVRDSDGRVFFNEINTIPGMTDMSMFPKLCEAGGLPMPEALQRIFAGAVKVSRESRNRLLSYGEML